MKNSYWEKTGEFQHLYNRLWNAYVPDEGACSNRIAEMFRCVSRLAFDFWNNGFHNLTGHDDFIAGAQKMIDTAIGEGILWGTNKQEALVWIREVVQFQAELADWEKDPDTVNCPELVDEVVFERRLNIVISAATLLLEWEEGRSGEAAYVKSLRDELAAKTK